MSPALPKFNPESGVKKSKRTVKRYPATRGVECNMTLPERTVNYPVKFSRGVECNNPVKFSRGVECNVTLPERTVKNPVKLSRGVKSSDAERTVNDTCGDAHCKN